MKKKLSQVLLLGILLLAAFVRLYKIADYMTFLGDEGRDVLVVYNILHGHVTLLGPTSSVGGFFLGPIYYYFMTPFLLLFNYNPVGPAIMVGLFGVATVWFIYKLGREFFSEEIGLLAAFFYSISPLVIAYSRSSWNPNLMPFFTVLTLYVLYKALQKESMKLFFFCGFLLGILLQLHYLATFVCAIVFFYMLFLRVYFKKKFQWTWITLVGGLIQQYSVVFIGFLVGFSPFLAFEARHGFQNLKSITAFIFHSQNVSGGSNYGVIVQDVFFRLFGRLVTDFPPPEQVSLAAHSSFFVWYLFTWMLGVISILYFIIQLITVIKADYNEERENQSPKIFQYILIFLWFTLGVLFFGFYKKQIYDYYFGFLFPLPFLLVSNMIVLLWRKNIFGKIAMIGVFIFLAYINIQSIPFRYQPNRQLHQAETIAKFVFDKTEGQPFNFALITGGDSDYAYRYFFTAWNHPPVTILNTVEDPQRKSVTNQLLVVCETYPCAPLGNSLWEVAGFGRAEIVGHWNVSVVQVFKLAHYAGNGQ